MPYDFTKLKQELDKLNIPEEIKENLKKLLSRMNVEELKTLWKGIHTRDPNELAKMMALEEEKRKKYKEEFDKIMHDAPIKVREMQEDAQKMADIQAEKEVLEELKTVEDEIKKF